MEITAKQSDISQFKQKRCEKIVVVCENNNTPISTYIFKQHIKCWYF